MLHELTKKETKFLLFQMNYNDYFNSYFVLVHKSSSSFPTDFFHILSHIEFISFIQCTTCTKSNLWTSYQQQQQHEQCEGAKNIPLRRNINAQAFNCITFPSKMTWTYTLHHELC